MSDESEYAYAMYGDTLEKLAPLFKSIYRRNKSGCCLHIVIEDGNWESLGDPDDKKDYPHKDCREAARLLLTIPLEYRELIGHDGGKELEFVDEDEHRCPECGREF